jgi:hypothetical protein
MLKKIQTMELPQQTAADYYKKHRKHSILSRITILSSMAILLIVLALNVSTLYSQDQSTTTTHASTPENIEKLLPSLPQGCHYFHVNNTVKVDCPKATPTAAITIPINVALPQLPPQCNFVTSPNGSSVQCTQSHTPIPTVTVNLPATCTPAHEPDTVTCTDKNKQTLSIQLPKIPDGCSYVLQANTYYVVCEAK